MVTWNTKHGGLNRRSSGDYIFDVVNTAAMALFLFCMAYPLYFTLIASFSDSNAVGTGKVWLWPVGFTLEPYKLVFENNQIWTGYRNSILYAVLSIAWNLFLEVPVAYALSKKWLAGRKFFTWYWLLLWWIPSGLIPQYLLRASTLHLTDTIWVMVLGGVSFWNVVVLRTYFQTNLADEIFEAAEIDGSSEFGKFFRIALPLSTPVLAVISLFLFVSSWNGWFGAMLYISTPDKYPLQLVLRQILMVNDLTTTIPAEIVNTLTDSDQITEALAKQRIARSMQYSTIYIGAAPLLIAYPFVQKYFVKGILVGSLKG